MIYFYIQYEVIKLKNSLRLIPLVLLIILSYAFAFFTSYIFKYLLYYFLGLFLLAIINLVVAIKTKSEDYYYLAKCNMIAKLILIPYYVFVFFVGFSGCFFRQ